MARLTKLSLTPTPRRGVCRDVRQALADDKPTTRSARAAGGPMISERKPAESRAKLLPGPARASSPCAVDAEAAARAHDLLAIVAHDFLNALNALQLTARALEHHAALVHDDYVGSSAHTVAHVTARLGRLAHDLTDCALLEEGRLALVNAPFEPSEVLQAAVAELAPVAAQKQMQLRVEPPERSGRAHGDRDRLLQVLVNLGGNALKFAPRRTEVVFSAHFEPGALRFSVRDEGPGIAAPLREHVFRPGVRADRADGGGTGLGLAIARTVVEAMGGAIWLEDTPAPGATFSFCIPRAEASSEGCSR